MHRRLVPCKFIYTYVSYVMPTSIFEWKMITAFCAVLSICDYLYS